jgi:hypothetical protein
MSRARIAAHGKADAFHNAETDAKTNRKME